MCVSPSRLKAIQEQYIAIYGHVSSGDTTFQPATDPRLINSTKLRQPYISVVHLLEISWLVPSTGNETALRRHANTGMQQLITYVSTDEDEQAFGSSSNLRLVPNEAEATVFNNCRSLAASMRDRQISILRGPRVYLKMALERLANRCHRTIVAK
jgi:hypothetical protein